MESVSGRSVPYDRRNASECSGRDSSKPKLYPIQKSKLSRIKIRDEPTIAGPEKSRRKSSILAISFTGHDQGRRWSASDLIKNWRQVTIQATVEKDLVVQKLDSILKNLELGVYDQAKQARKLGVKCMWLFLVVVMHIILIYEISQRTIQYYYNPVITTFAIQTPSAIEFPVVYVCMAAAANLTFMLEHPKEYAQSNKFRERIVTARRKRNAPESSDLSNSELWHYLNLHDSFSSRVPRGTIQSNVTDFDVYKFFHDAGYKVKETFLECSFYGAVEMKLDCEKIVEPILDINYGICYAVKLHGRKQRRAGAGMSIFRVPVGGLVVSSG